MRSGTTSNDNQYLKLLCLLRRAPSTSRASRGACSSVCPSFSPKASEDLSNFDLYTFCIFPSSASVRLDYPAPLKSFEESNAKNAPSHPAYKPAGTCVPLSQFRRNSRPRGLQIHASRPSLSPVPDKRRGNVYDATNKARLSLFSRGSCSF